MKAEIKPSCAFGKITVPTSKSVAHRLLICAALAEGVSVIKGITPCEDVLATVDCLSALGAKIDKSGDTYTVWGCDMKHTSPSGALRCRESGSTLRFLIPIVALSGARVELEGARSLLSRPLSVYEKIFKERDMLLERSDRSICVSGPLSSGEYTVRGDVSSQFITGLLFALPLASKDSVIRIIPPFESKSYIDLTVLALKKFGITVEFTDGLTIKIPGGQKYAATDFTVEGDYSGSAFLDALNLFGSEVEVLGLNTESAQGDRAYLSFYPQLTAGSPVIDIGNCPDLGPILFTIAAAYNGATFTGTARLKIKESDRASVMAKELRRFGAEIEVLDDSVIVKKCKLHSPNEPSWGHNDHRVVMSLSVLMTKYGGVIEGAEAVKKSYPDFFDDIKKAGIEVTLYD